MLVSARRRINLDKATMRMSKPDCNSIQTVFTLIPMYELTMSQLRNDHEQRRADENYGILNTNDGRQKDVMSGFATI